MKIIVSVVVAVCLLMSVVLLSYYDRKGTPPIEVASAIISCAQTVCETQATSSICAQLSTAITGCLSSGLNAAVCLAGVPALMSVGYADMVCVVAALAAAPPKPIAYRETSKSVGISENKSGEILYEIPDVQQQAIKWLRTQQVVIKP
jgi:hypothetical protein